MSMLEAVFWGLALLAGVATVWFSVVVVARLFRR
jgi:hypothetical protein